MGKPTDITLGNRSEATGRYNFVVGDDGDVEFDDKEAHAVMTSVIEHRGSYSADKTHGSDLFTLKSLTSRTPSQAAAMALEGLQSIEADNTIAAGTKVSAQRNLDGSGLGRLDIEIDWKTPTGSSGRQKANI